MRSLEVLEGLGRGGRRGERKKEGRERAQRTREEFSMDYASVNTLTVSPITYSAAPGHILQVYIAAHWDSGHVLILTFLTVIKLTLFLQQCREPVII